MPRGAIEGRAAASGFVECPLPFGGESQGRRTGIVDWRQVEAGRTIRGQAAIGHAVVEGYAGVVVSRWGIAPSAVAIVDQGTVAGGDGQVAGGEARVINITGIGQQLGLGDQACATVLGDGVQSHRGSDWRIVRAADGDRDGLLGAVFGAHGEGVAQAARIVEGVDHRIAVVEAVGPDAASRDGEGAITVLRGCWGADGLEDIIAVVDVNGGQGAADGVAWAVFNHCAARGTGDHGRIVAAGDGDGHGLVDEVASPGIAVFRPDGVMQNQGLARRDEVEGLAT